MSMNFLKNVSNFANYSLRQLLSNRVFSIFKSRWILLAFSSFLVPFRLGLQRYNRFLNYQILFKLF